ncbi:MAG: hypothetical protein AAF657_23510 [Acidobacteriota bacterium]
MRRLRFNIALLVLPLWLVGASTAQARSPFGAPDGFGQLAIYMANGAFDLNAPHPQVPGCFQSLCDPSYFHEVIMGWTPTEVQAEEAAAKAFFAQRFGVDVESLVAEGRLHFRGAYADPRLGYRLFHLSGQKVQGTGWEVHDGAYLAIVTDPAGLELGGEFDGVHVPAGAYLAFGLYNIHKTLPSGQPAGEILIRFKSLTPIVANADGTVMFRCELEHADWGPGLAQATLWSELLVDGRTQYSIRSILTFPGLGD